MASVSYIDAHAHMFDAEFADDLDDVIVRAKEAGTQCVQVVAISSKDCPKILELTEKYPGFCLPGFGVHPVQHQEDGSPRSVTLEDFDALVPWIADHHEKLTCIGEVGLDFTPKWAQTPDEKQSQRDVLRKQVELSKKYDLPLNVHSRSAGKPTIELLKECGAEKVLLHAFDGRMSVATLGLDAGYYFSIPPSVKRGETKQKLVKHVPLERLILETDSPALGPEKQVRNEPANIRISCEMIAEIKKLDVETVARTLWENTLRLFPRIVNYLPK